MLALDVCLKQVWPYLQESKYGSGIAHSLGVCLGLRKVIKHVQIHSNVRIISMKLFKVSGWLGNLC